MQRTVLVHIKSTSSCRFIHSKPIHYSSIHLFIYYEKHFMKASSMLGALLPLNEMDKDFAPIEPPFLSGECENKEGNTKFSVSY